MEKINNKYYPRDPINRILHLDHKDKYLDNPAETRISYLTTSGKRTDAEISLSGLVTWRNIIGFYVNNEKDLIHTLNNLQWIYENKEKLNSMNNKELLKIPFFYEENNKILFNSNQVMNLNWSLKDIINNINNAIADKSIDQHFSEIYKISSIQYLNK